ncbi:MAG: DUF481 domain-containing protein [Planctomycetes bacterium]|nr:DUF481 domain-containing protein [Planctomycetota bacterium]
MIKKSLRTFHNSTTRRFSASFGFTGFTAIAICLIAIISLAGIASADVVTLINGDRITGVVVKKEKNVLKLKTSYAGEIEIQWSQVSRLEMDEAVKVVLNDKTVVLAIVIARGGAEDPLKPADKEAAGTLETDQVDMINPETRDLGEAGKFTGRFNFTMKLESRSDQTDEIDTDFEIKYRRGKNRFKMRGQLDYDEKFEQTTKRDWIIIPKYDRFFTDKLYGSLWYIAAQEKYQGLELRQTVGPSIGYQFFEGKPTTLTSEIGMVFVDEDYIDSEDDEYYGPAWQLKFEQDLFKGRIQFYHNNYFILNAENTGKWLWRSWTGFRIPITHGIIGSLEYEIDYDSEPARRGFKNDNTLRAKLGYAW